MTSVGPTMHLSYGSVCHPNAFRQLPNAVLTTAQKINAKYTEPRFERRYIFAPMLAINGCTASTTTRLYPSHAISDQQVTFSEFHCFPFITTLKLLSSSGTKGHHHPASRL
ncbi:hypothetical protein CEXT_680061 [Caerostris extrusa]|uniref:Uncharacterized protein n=1 Tax=Caerostris extrusa TaxID=172846 RepID=A0AAV4VA02_CAEEX|nr:hypothetical protein CEXT_680061 [Caerostris extrusa]